MVFKIGARGDALELPTPTYRKHEVQFCSDVSKWADRLFEANRELPFGSSDIESFGRGSQKRQDFRVYERKPEGRGRLALCGEVKLPGSAQGRSPFDMAVVQDAFDKATRENSRYFFTWNVEHLALFDRSLWDSESMYQRCIGEWKLGMELNQPSDVTRPEVSARLRETFLPGFFAEFGQIWLNKKADVRPLPADFWVTVLESHLAGPMGPVRELRDYLSSKSESDKGFDTRLRLWAVEQQWNFDRKNPQSWRETVDRAARSMAYVLSNRILFYQAVRLRNDLPQLKFPRSAKTARTALAYLRESFGDAVRVTGDYEPVFFPDSPDEWAALTALSGTNSLEAWDKFIRAVDRFNFKEIPTDVLGRIFQKLIGPEERHKFGQHYTDENIVDVINAFCIRTADAKVLDPACGSGTFLVRAYYHKSQLDKRLRNQELLEGLYGCDINPFPAHLATLNLAARNISNEENYPRVARKNFFTVAIDKAFCELPKATRDRSGNRERDAIALPELDAVVGNPPYVRHEEIPKKSEQGVIVDQTKEFIYDAVEHAWRGIELSRQSDLHIYFWPFAAHFLAEGGWFGFLTSSSWLDVRYGFPLQRWLLRNFRIVAVIESVDEPWFEDARVKTAVTILQRTQDAAKRDENLVRFVRVKRPLAEILGDRQDERQRQESAEEFRDLILSTRADRSTGALRIMVKRQRDLWAEGVMVSEMLSKQATAAGALIQVDEGESGEEEAGIEGGEIEIRAGEYGGGKWGRYLRAPDFYFEMMREFGHRFTRLGEVATIKFGIKSGCDAFFMPRNLSAKLLLENQSELEWAGLPLMRRCRRADVESGKLVIVQCGDGTIHPIEKEFVRPEVHSLMQVDRPVVLPEQLDRVVLWVNQKLNEIKGTYAHHYIIWGSKQTFASKKSKPVPVPMRSTCQGRDPWYDVTGLKSGVGFWPMAQKYRHIVPWNPSNVPCNHNLFDIHADTLSAHQQTALMAVLNSTLVGLFKHFYGRYAGSEGTLKTEIVDALMMEIPSPRAADAALTARVSEALQRISQRPVTHLVEQTFLECHGEAELRQLQQLPLGLPIELTRKDRRQLDLLIFELLGVSDAKRRNKLVDRLYTETSAYYREQRSQDIRSNINKAKGAGGASISAHELALDAWNNLDLVWRKPLSEWLEEQTGKAKTVELPEGEVHLPSADHFFESATLFFGKNSGVNRVCANRAEAELLALIAREGLRGPVPVPRTEKECAALLQKLSARIAAARARFDELAEERAGTDKLRAQVVDQLNRWFVHGRPT